MAFNFITQKRHQTTKLKSATNPNQVNSKKTVPKNDNKTARKTKTKEILKQPGGKKKYFL